MNHNITRQTPPSANRRGQFEQGYEQTVLEPGARYTIDTNAPIDTEVRNRYFACAMVTAAHAAPSPEHLSLDDMDNFLIVNIKDVPTEQTRNAINQAEGFSYKRFHGIVIPGSPDFLVLNREFTPGQPGTHGWLPLSHGESATIGNNPASRAHFTDITGYVSREHITLTDTNGELSITDTSRNGTTVTTARPLTKQSPESVEFDAQVQSVIEYVGGEESPLSPQTVGHIVVDIASRYHPDAPHARQQERAIRRAYHPDAHRNELPDRAHAKSLAADKLLRDKKQRP